MDGQRPVRGEVSQNGEISGLPICDETANADRARASALMRRRFGTLLRNGMRTGNTMRAEHTTLWRVGFEITIGGSHETFLGRSRGYRCVLDCPNIRGRKRSEREHGQTRIKLQPDPCCRQRQYEFVGFVIYGNCGLVGRVVDRHVGFQADAGSIGQFQARFQLVDERQQAKAIRPSG